MAKERKPREMTEEELAGANGEPLPERHVMSVIRGVQPLPQPIVLDPGPGEWTIDPPPPDEA